MFMCVNICSRCLERFILNYPEFLYGSSEMGGLEKICCTSFEGTYSYMWNTCLHMNGL
jgi:hypothetical protein